MSKFLEKLKSVSTVTEYGYGAFGESERYQKLDVDKFAQNIINECINVLRQQGEIAKIQLDPNSTTRYAMLNFSANVIKEHFEEK